MKKFVSLLALFALLLFSGCATLSSRAVHPGQQRAYAMKERIVKTLELEYYLYLPDSYDDKGKSWPVMVFLHGAGERGDDIEQVAAHGPPKLAGHTKDLPFIVVSPQCPENEIWTDNLEEPNHLLDSVLEIYNTDTSRVYLTGLSMGGFGTWAWAIKNPGRFAAAAPVCGGGDAWMTYRIKDVPFWVFHGAKDAVVPLARSESMVEALKKNGGNVKFTVYPEANHDSWTETYNNPALYEWFLKHKKR